MAHNNPDPFEDLIAEGKLRKEPYHIDFKVVVLEVSLDRLADNLYKSLNVTYGQWEPLLTRYSGTRAEVTQAIQDDVTNMVDFALWVTYNRLRAVAERYSPLNARTERIYHRAPCSNLMEFPTFLSSTLQGIGPLRIVDAPEDVMVIYAPPDKTADNYGRGAEHHPNEGKYRRLLSLLRALNVQCSPIDLTPTQGSFATTCKFKKKEGKVTDGLVSILGSVHGSHYTNDDIKKFLLLAYKDNTPLDDVPPNTNMDNTPFDDVPPNTNMDNTPFADVSLTVGYVNDAATLNALAKVAAPPNIPKGQTATSDGRPCGFIYPVNYFGILPEVKTPRQQRGCYVIGRGVDPIFTVYLAQRLTAYEINSILRHHLTRTG